MPNYIESYAEAPEPAFEGMLADARGKNALTKTIVATSASNTADVKFGLAVGAGSNDGEAKLNGSGFLGATLADRAQTTDGAYAVGAQAAILHRGVIYVKAAVAVVPTDTVAFKASDGTWGKKATGYTDVDHAKYLDTGAVGALVRLDLS